VNGIASAHDAGRHVTGWTVTIVMRAIVAQIVLTICATVASAFMGTVGRFGVTFAEVMAGGGRVYQEASGVKRIRLREWNTSCAVR